MFDFMGFYMVSEDIEKNQNLCKNESYRRTGVSRAYYSCYKISDEFLRSNYPLYNGLYGQGSHKNLWNFFNNESSLKQLNVGNAGFRVFDLRKKADYNSHEKVTNADLKLANREARKVIDKISEKN